MSATVDILFRIEKGEDLSNLEMDNNFRKLKIACDGLLLTASQQASPTSSRIGEIIQWGSNTLPTNALWLNGVDISRTTYASLFAIWGTTFGAGNGTTTFTVPKMMGRLSIGASTIGGQTDTTFGTFTLGQYYGAKEHTITQTLTLGAISLTSLTATLGTISVGSLTASAGSVDYSGLTATLGAISVGSLTTTVTLTNDPITGIGDISVSGASCVPQGLELGTTAMSCTAPLTVSAVSMAAALTSHVKVNTATIGGSIASPSITLGGVLPSPAITVGGSIASPSITIGGSIASPTISGVSITTPIIPPTVCLNFMTYYQ